MYYFVYVSLLSTHLYTFWITKLILPEQYLQTLIYMFLSVGNDFIWMLLFSIVSLRDSIVERNEFWKQIDLSFDSDSGT